MLRPVLAAAAVAALSFAGPAVAQGHDSIFGSFFSRAQPTQASSTDASSRVSGARAADAREREARDMRRGYWERERARLAGQTATRGESSVTR